MRARTISALCGVIGIFAVCAAGFLSGCANGHNQFAYVVGQTANEVFEFQVHGNGALTPLGTPNFAVGSNPASVAGQTFGNFLYVADFAGNDVTQLDINKNSGNLSVPVSSSIVVPVNPPNIFATGTGPISLAMSPTAPFLYVANQTSGNITAFTANPNTGSLTLIGNFLVTSPTLSHPSSLSISPKGDLLFVANPGEGTVVPFAIGANGALTAGTPVSMGVGATPGAVVVGRNGGFLFVTDTAHNAVLGFSVQGGGALAPISGSPFAAGAGADRTGHRSPGLASVCRELRVPTTFQPM